jgi:hypothetical protein
VRGSQDSQSLALGLTLAAASQLANDFSTSFKGQILGTT